MTVTQPDDQEKPTMETVGIMATLVAAAGVLVGAAIVVRSLPDIAHYLRLRKM